MTVNLQAPNPDHVLAVPGVRLGIAEAGVRKVGRKDLTVILLDEGSAVSVSLRKTAIALRLFKFAAII